MGLWKLTSRARRFVVAVMLGCFIPVVASTYACTAQCLHAGSGHIEFALADIDDSPSPDLYDGFHGGGDPIAYFHAGSCHLAWTPGALFSHEASLLQDGEEPWSDPQAERFVSFVASPPEPPPRQRGSAD